jgi:hypothetical protein
MNLSGMPREREGDLPATPYSMASLGVMYNGLCQSCRVPTHTLAKHYVSVEGLLCFCDEGLLDGTCIPSTQLCSFDQPWVGSLCQALDFIVSLSLPSKPFPCDGQRCFHRQSVLQISHRIQLLHGMAGVLAEDFQEGLLLGKHLPPLDLDLDCLSLTGGRHSRLLKHGCNRTAIIQSEQRTNCDGSFPHAMSR